MIDQQNNGDLQSQPLAFYKKILLILLVAFLFISMLGVILWYIGKNRNQPQQPQQLAFNSTTQFLPPGATSLPVKVALTAFNLSQPLPFFDERNVVQSLKLGISSTTSSATSTSRETKEPVKHTPSFLSYRIYGQSVPSVREALTVYFISLGWKQIDDKSNQQLLMFDSDNKQSILINILKVSSTSGKESYIVVALSLRVFNL